MGILGKVLEYNLATKTVRNLSVISKNVARFDGEFLLVTCVAYQYFESLDCV